MAGGRSRRMGFDKASALIAGRSLLARVLDALATTTPVETFVVGGDRELTESLGIAHVRDLAPGEGPLGAVMTALDHTSATLLLCAACDLPNLTASSLECLLAGLDGHDAAVPSVDGQAQWHLTAWDVDRSRVEVADAFTVGCRAIRELATRLDVAIVEGFDPVALHDVDTPEDLAATIVPTPYPETDLACD